jgi:hypothetical protein
MTDHDRNRKACRDEMRPQADIDQVVPQTDRYFPEPLASPQHPLRGTGERADWQGMPSSSDAAVEIRLSGVFTVVHDGSVVAAVALGSRKADLGATVAAGNVVVGHRLGLYAALAAAPATADGLAARTETHPRYVTEWLRGQAAGGYMQYDPDTQTYSMSEEQAFVLANPDGAVYAPGAFVLALGTLRA